MDREPKLYFKQNEGFLPKRREDRIAMALFLAVSIGAFIGTEVRYSSSPAPRLENPSFKNSNVIETRIQTTP